MNSILLEKIEATLRRRVDMSTTQACWLWPGGTAGGGYGHIVVQHEGEQVQIPAHRAAWLVFRGPIPKDKFVCHTCDVRNCVNPNHLFLGSQRMNIQDCAAKGRITGMKLTKEQAIEVYTSNETQAVLAKKFDLSRDTITLIKQRKRYAWATEGQKRGMWTP